MQRRVVITGMGTINPLGCDVETTWRNLVAGKSGVDLLTRFDASDFQSRIAAEVRDFDPSKYIAPREARRMDPFLQFALVATMEALDQAQLPLDSEADQIGVLFGTSIGALETALATHETLTKKGPRRVSPLSTMAMIPSIAAGVIAIKTGARGPNFCIASACATGTNVIGEAWEIIRRGDAKAMIAGASDALILPLIIGGLDRAQALSRRNDEPQKASRPFDAQRDGFVLGEGAGALILEELHSARARGAGILAEIIGYGGSSDAYHIITPPEGGSGAALAMARTLRKAQIEPQEVDYINAHGTSTILNDKAETEAIKDIFGEYAYRVPISSTKSMTGHLSGAAGAVEAIICVKTIQEGIIPPTINYEYPDPDCDLDYVPNEARPAQVKIALCNSFGLGGHNACLLLKAFQG
jgi:3-oxoacyl-[acyl-carrier-protein] synthase II